MAYVRKHRAAKTLRRKFLSVLNLFSIDKRILKESRWQLGVFDSPLNYPQVSLE
jgi:hypothetical protein